MERPPRHPLEAPTLIRSARALARGDVTAARDVLWQALAVEPNLPGVTTALARLCWPGPDFRDWLALLHDRLRPGVYLEIGVERGESLCLARAPTQAIGVDPAPVGDPLARCIPGTRLYAARSADFLAAPPPETGLAQRGFDLAFIDGDHRFEQVLADFIGCEALAAPRSLIALHDTVPVDTFTAQAERQSGFYSGDGWKIVPCLQALRPELRVITLPVAPTGLTLVTGLVPGSTVLAERRGALVAAYARLDARRIAQRPGEVIRLGRNDPAWVRRWLNENAQ